MQKNEESEELPEFVTSKNLEVINGLTVFPCYPVFFVGLPQRITDFKAKPQFSVFLSGKLLPGELPDSLGSARQHASEHQNQQ